MNFTRFVFCSNLEDCDSRWALLLHSPKRNSLIISSYLLAGGLFGNSGYKFAPHVKFESLQVMSGLRQNTCMWTK